MNTMSSTKFHHLLYNINILGEELYKYLCFRSNPINYLYLSMYMYVVLNYEINMFKLNGQVCQWQVCPHPGTIYMYRVSQKTQSLLNSAYFF